ncbi:MAG: AI-2E family transporter [Anaerolineae bacterium]|nr:AI-2E family transporter [Anaerolineae bacterium]
MGSNSRLSRIALTLAIIALLIFIAERLWTFGQLISTVVSTVAGAWFLAFLVKPLVRWLTDGIVPARVVSWVRQRYGFGAAERLRLVRLPLGIAVTLVYLLVLMTTIGLAVVATVTLIPQAADLIRRLPEFANATVRDAQALWGDVATRFGLEADILGRWLATLDLPRQVTQAAGAAASQVLNIAAVTAGFISQFILVIVLSLFIVVEDRLLKQQLFMVLPARMHEGAAALISAVDRAFSGYLRAQVIGAGLRSAFTLLVFSLFQVSFGFVVALVFGLLSFIPLIGGPVGVLIVLVVALIVRPEAALAVTLLVLAFDQIVAYAVLPRLVRHTVGVPSLVAIIAISIGVQTLGFWGLIFGVPIVGAAYAVVFEFWLPRREGRGLVAPAAETAAPTPAEAPQPIPAPSAVTESAQVNPVEC